MSIKDDFDDADDYKPRDVFLRPMLNSDSRALLDVMREYMTPSGNGDYHEAMKFLDENINSIQTIVLRGGKIGGFVSCDPCTKIYMVFPSHSNSDKSAVIQAVLDGTARISLANAKNGHSTPASMALAVPAGSFTNHFWPAFHDAKGGATFPCAAPWGQVVRMTTYRIESLAERFTRTPAKVMDIPVPAIDLNTLPTPRV